MATAKRKILIAVDNSENAETALRNYLDNFHRSDNEVILLHVLDPMPVHAVNALKAALIISENDVKKREDERTIKWRELSDKYMSLCKDKYCLEPRMLIKESSSAGEVIVQTADEEHCSAIVLGCAGRGIRHARLGSVSRYVLHESNIPVAACR